MKCILKRMHLNVLFIIQTMGGNFTAKGQQNCSKGIYVLAGIYLSIPVCVY